MIGIKLTLDDALLLRIDEARGDVPRVRWIRRVIEEALPKRKILLIRGCDKFVPKPTNALKCEKCGKFLREHQ